MTPEQLQPPTLTADQQETAQDLIDWCGLADVADEPLEMMGEKGTVRYGLGRCAHHFARMSPEPTPDDIRQMVLTKLKEQKTKPSGLAAK